MDWSNEPYVKVYTRETDDDLVLSWDALSVWRAMLLKFDRSGLIETKRGARGLAALVKAPIEVVERAVVELLQDGRIVETERGFLAPNFIDAQEAIKSDKLRQKDSRDRRRSRSLDQDVTKRDGVVTKRDQTSRGSDHAEQNVTLCFADPLQSGASSAGSNPQAPHLPPEPPEQNPEPRDTRPLALAQRQKINHDVWEQARLAHDLLRSNGIDPGAIAWTVMPSGIGGNDLVARTRELADLGDEKYIRATYDRVIAVATAEAKREKHLRWFKPSSLFAEDKFWKAAETSPEQAATRTVSKFAPAERKDVRIRRDDDAPPPMPLVGKAGGA